MSRGEDMLRTSLIFGAAAIVATLAATPFLETRTMPAFHTLDATTTGSLAKERTYTLRKSVLQATPASVCVIRGQIATGDC